MGLVDRVSHELELASSRDLGDTPTLTLDEYATFFQYGGVTYPFIQTTLGSVDEERIILNAIAAYEGNGPIFALVQARLQAFSQIRFQWTRFTGAVPGDLFGDADLKILENPWPNGRTSSLLARMEVDNSLCGNCYIVRPRKDRLARLRPDMVRIVLGSQMDGDFPADAPDVEIAGYAYWPRSGNVQFFTPDQVAHYAPIPDPNYQFLGMSWMTPVIREMQADSLATEHKFRFFENAATPNLAIKFDPSVSIDHVKQFKALLENEHRGAFNAYKTLYLGGGADTVPIGANWQQLDFAATQGKGESRLAAAAGVPPSWVGFSEGLQGSSLNAGNFNSSRRRFTDGTMYHLWSAAAEALQSIVPPSQGQSLWFDSRVPFMREDASDIAAIQAQQALTISTLVQQGFDAASAVKAVANNDMTLLKHTGLLSVQLQKPGEAPPSSNGPALPASNVSGSTGQGSVGGSQK